MANLPAPRPHHAPPWSLTVACYSGLSNRLRVLTSGLALAEATGRSFTMLWPVRNKSGAPYTALFENDWNVITQDPAPPSRDWLPQFGGEMNREWFDLAASPQPALAFSCATWLVEPSFVPAQAPLFQRAGELLSQLRPVPAVAERVAAFRAEHFRPQMIGVHLRRVEFNRLLPFSAHNTGPALAALRRLLVALPDAGIFLSTDDGGPDPVTGAVQYEGVREKLRAAFGERVVWTQPRTLECSAVEGVQDALVDLLLLRATDAVVGTWFSSFSELAAAGRPVPLIYCRSGGAWAAAEWALRTSGGLAWLRGESQRRYAGRAHPLTVLQYYLRTPRRESARLFQRLAPQLFGRVRSLIRSEARPDA